MTSLLTHARTDGDGPGGRAVGGSAVPLTRLTVVELRKLADTRAGLWLLLVIALAAVGTAVVLITAGPAAEQTFATFFTFGLLPSAVLLPVLGILAMTGEWSQRTAMTTFALVPARGRVIVAKLAAAVLIAVASTLVTGAVAVVGNLVALSTGGAGDWAAAAALIARCVLLEVILVLMGSAFGALLLHSPLAIVLYFVVPTLWSALGEMVRWLHAAAGWLDINITQAPLTEATMSGDQWVRLGTSVALWVVAPLAVGVLRVLRAEVA